MNHEEKNPWTRLSTAEIYENPWIKVEEDQVLKPNGEPGIYGRVHFKNKAIGIVAIDEVLNTWLVGQYRYTLEEYCWEIPTGGGPLNETPLESAKRELREETGISARSWENILRIHTSNSVTDEEGFVFLAKDLSYGDTEFDDTEDLLIKKMPLKEALDMVMKNEITDSLSIAGLLKVARLLEI
ncbi:MAG: NUDIX domain-containing protein [Cyclobacteriaceae bacterium]